MVQQPSERSSTMVPLVNYTPFFYVHRSSNIDRGQIRNQRIDYIGKEVSILFLAKHAEKKINRRQKEWEITSRPLQPALITMLIILSLVNALDLELWLSGFFCLVYLMASILVLVLLFLIFICIYDCHLTRSQKLARQQKQRPITHLPPR